jgi:hypothetical protein
MNAAIQSGGQWISRCKYLIEAHLKRISGESAAISTTK